MSGEGGVMVMVMDEWRRGGVMVMAISSPFPLGVVADFDMSSAVLRGWQERLFR